MNMKTNHKVITLGLAFGLLGSTGAFAKPYLENRGLSHEESTVTRHVPTAETSGTIAYLRAPAAHAVHEDSPSDMLLG
jgi:hypothetical protein